VEIAHDAALLQDVVRHHAERLAHALEQAEQIAGRPLALLREPAEIAEQHRHIGLARGEGLLGVLPANGFQHDRRKELAQARLPRRQQP